MNEFEAVVKMDNGKTNCWAHQHRRRDARNKTYEKCSEFAKERARRRVIINDKDGKVREIAPSE